jgi:outer membrane protein OmpA-like peptidoglycan-associated protein
MSFMASILVFCAVGSVWSQEAAKAQSTAFQLQQFRPWGDNRGLFQTQSGETMGQWSYMAGVFFNYSYRPLTLRTQGSTDAQGVLDHQIGVDVLAGIGIFNWLDLSLAFPMSIYQMGKIPDNTLFDQGLRNKDLSGFALSDLKIHLKLQALKAEKHWLNLGFQIFLGIPIGDKEKMGGADGLSFGAAVFINKRFSIVNVGLNVGYRYMPETRLINLDLNHEIFYSGGLGVQLGSHFELLGELAGATVLSANTNVNTSPLELYLGGRILPLGNDDLGINIGVGFGLVNGYGSPLLRALLGVVWSPKVRDKDGDGIPDHLDRCPTTPGPKENDGCPWPDRDGDGIPDKDDKCPDKPGPKEFEGCPDTDNDGIPDHLDKCPDKPGPKENEGCPDTDGDGIPDHLDKCPDKPGPKENEGCPWSDRDGDGIPDKDDRCPDQAGLKEFDGCPDRDGDGIPDHLDKCPDRAGPKEFEGCPDRDGDGIPDHLDECPDVPGVKVATKTVKLGCPKKILVVVKEKEIQILEKIQFRTNSAVLLRPSYLILDQVISVMKSRPDIRVRIEGHTDTVGRPQYNLQLSKRRANSVREYLLMKGINEKRLESEGYGMSVPLVPNTSKENRAQNRRVQFTVLNPDKNK